MENNNFTTWKVIDNILSTLETEGLIMTIENNENISSEDAQQALNVVMKMERASLQQSLPPIWFGIAMAFTIGVLVFTIAAALRDYYVFPIIAIPLILAIRAKKTQALPKTPPLGMKGIITMFSLIIILLALIAGGRLLMEIYQITWAPIIAGSIAAITIYLLSISERNHYLKVINGE